MGNKGFDEEDVLGYVRGGWHFRAKTVKGRKYITRRKGQEERGVGPFDPDLWASINRLIPQTAEEEAPSIQEESVLGKDTNDLPKRTHDWVRRSEEFRMELRRLQEYIFTHRGLEMVRTCMHIDDEGFCTYWSWENKPNYFGLFEELMGSGNYKKQKISKKDLPVDRWLVKAIHWYCSCCPVYQASK
jgi:hypothetical protein